MKFRFFLVGEIYRLQQHYNIDVLKPRTKHKDLKKRIEQVKKLTKFLESRTYKNYTRIQARLDFLENGFKICPCCGHNILNFYASTCSISCGTKLKHKNEDPKLKEVRLRKAASSRNYKEIHQKRIKTMKETGADKIAKEKAKQTMLLKIDENGHNGFQQRSLKAVETIGDRYIEISKKACQTRKENNSNSSKTFWDSLTLEQKETYIKKKK